MDINKNDDVNTFIINNIETKCSGCINNYLGQDEHMECNNGCLHNQEECDICKKIDKQSIFFKMPQQSFSDKQLFISN